MKKFVVCGIAAFMLLGVAAAKKPNIIFLITDDQNRETLSCYGGNALTPNIDKLAGEGIRFTRFTTSSPVCTPTRYTCLSGRYASRARGLQKNWNEGESMSIEWNTTLEPDLVNVPKVMKANGYRTGMVGKWHVGGLNEAEVNKLKPESITKKSRLTDPGVQEFLELRQRMLCETMRKSHGFDYVSRFYPGNAQHRHLPEALDVHNLEWVMEGAFEFLDETPEDQPFFLYLATTISHAPYPVLGQDDNPYICEGGLLKTLPKAGMPSRKSVFERVKEAGTDPDLVWATWLDDAVGSLRNKLEEMGELENTLIIYFSDQEVAAKGSLYYNGVGSPTFITQVGKTPHAVSDANLQNVDFAPTIFDYCGITPPDDMLLDGRSFMPLLKGEELKNWKKVQYCEIGYFRSVITDQFRYISLRVPENLPEKAERMGGITWETKVTEVNGNPLKNVPMYEQWHRRHKEAWTENWWDQDQLFDSRNDPQESRNLADSPEYAAQLEKMKSLLSEELERFPFSYGEFK
ncbi:sulfatase family protein [Pontiella agarivorans]|uniref:Sulfatase-like hydrolase/transferase n=1 Tax=Pontiella agarivorans TaxID=3038953 RepID=A0ABU5MY75_9BACT|nr:sulfatase-like hydrolase/transferase [Pontiella agarivorans]MDZ8119133.1 sulfatase-like hydrolase/transferase [Pontiella agarivorans]